MRSGRLSVKNDAIGVGDLVMMVYTDNDLLCEHARQFIGIPMRVRNMLINTLICADCGYQWQNAIIATFNGDTPTTYSALKVSWLKKIPPLVADETITEHERITA